jgi:hypothetical protein
MNADWTDIGRPETHATIAAAMEVHWELKFGLLEPFYQEICANLRKSADVSL